MARFLVKRIGLALITLILLSMIVFAVSSILPGNVGRAVLGPFATQESVDALNEQLGTNRSLFSQYIDWVQGLLHGDLGTSLTKQVPAWDLLWPALQNSFKLAFVAFVILVPLSILGGVIAGLRYGTADRQGNHDLRPLGLRDARLRHGDRAHPRLRRLARLAAGDGAGRARGEPARADRNISSCLRSRSRSSSSATSRASRGRE